MYCFSEKTKLTGPKPNQNKINFPHLPFNKTVKNLASLATMNSFKSRFILFDFAQNKSINVKNNEIKN